MAGPIQRWQDFSAELSQGLRNPPAPGSPEAIGSIVRGFFKFIVLAGLFLAAFEWSGSTAAAIDGPRFAAGFLCFAGYLYASFDGYTDVVRGFARLFDFHLPENFDRPIASGDFLDLWSRWHISLSDWFKLYLFNPLTKTMIGAAADRPRLVPLLGAAGYLATFLVMGLWHGTTARFAFYGLCLGVGAGINKLFQTAMLQRLGRRRYALVSQHALYIALSRGLAVTYFVLALGFFWLPSAAALSSPGICAAAVGLVFLVILALGAAAELVGRIGRRIAAVPRGWPLLAHGAELAGILLYLSAAQGAVPPLIYEFF
jgi:D-alanyl-lipoteichoic acid acyltransferase DltB (MBOAT superfamily)